jgi:peptidoglycan/LPS O-acetylase OafA/YrhL
LHRIAFANTLRGLAALSVVFYHYFFVFWSGRSTVAALTTLPELPFDIPGVSSLTRWFHPSMIFNCGAYGVALFFLISGFVIPLSLLKSSGPGFCVNRIFRVWPTYVAGFSMTLLAVAIGGAYFASPWQFTATEVFIHYIPGLRDLAWSRSIDGIVWTLEVEFKFYLVCALTIAWFRSVSLKVFILPIVISVVYLAIVPWMPVLLTSSLTAYRLAFVLLLSGQFVVFMFIGVTFSYWYQRRITPIQAVLFAAALFVVFCVLWSTGLPQAPFVLACNYGYALVTFSIAFAFPRLFASNRIFDFFADISYPLYAVHGIAGYVALRVLMDRGMPPSLALPIVTASALLVAYIVHLLIERPSQDFGRVLAAKAGSRNPGTAKEIRLVGG